MFTKRVDSRKDNRYVIIFTDTALHAAVKQIERALQFTQFVIAAFLDVGGTFDKAT